MANFKQNKPHTLSKHHLPGRKGTQLTGRSHPLSLPTSQRNSVPRAHQRDPPDPLAHWLRVHVLLQCSREIPPQITQTLAASVYVQINRGRSLCLSVRHNLVHLSSRSHETTRYLNLPSPSLTCDVGVGVGVYPRARLPPDSQYRYDVEEVTSILVFNITLM